MAKADKTLCKLVADDYHKKNRSKYLKLIRNPNYLCKKCGRVAVNEINLCKPEKEDI